MTTDVPQRIIEMLEGEIADLPLKDAIEIVEEVLSHVESMHAALQDEL